MSSCAFTGHRALPPDKLEYIREALYREIMAAVEGGADIFLSGFADGADLEFAAAVIRAKASFPNIKLIAAIPYEKRIYNRDPNFQELLGECSSVKIVSKEYFRDCFAVRNKYLIDNAERLIAVFDGRERSGTGQTLRMAKAANLDIHKIMI